MTNLVPIHLSEKTLSDTNDKTVVNGLVKLSDTTSPINSSITNNTLSLDYSTYLGGNKDDWGTGIAVDNTNNVYMTGNTYSSNFPTKNAFNNTYNDHQEDDLLVMKFSSNGGVVFSTYFGGSLRDESSGIGVDAFGNSFITGNTNSPDFPEKNSLNATNRGINDVFISKFNSSGYLEYSAILDEKNDSFIAHGIAVDGKGNSFIVGQIYFNLSYNVFIAKLNSVGTVEFIKEIGGNKEDYETGIALDSRDNIYITGITSSADFPTKDAFNSSFGGDASVFVEKYTPTGNLVFSTFLGDLDYSDDPKIAVDDIGNSYITGSTLSQHFPTKNAYKNTLTGNFDAFITKFSPSGKLLFSTYFEGSRMDVGTGICSDNSGNIYITGQTEFSDFPMKNAINSSFGGGVSDSFVAVFDSSENLIFSRYIGGTGNDITNGIMVSKFGILYITGHTDSPNFPTMNAIDSNNNGGWDAILMKFHFNINHQSSFFYLNDNFIFICLTIVAILVISITYYEYKIYKKIHLNLKGEKTPTFYRYLFNKVKIHSTKETLDLMDEIEQEHFE